jgi:hypothetical protein
MWAGTDRRHMEQDESAVEQVHRAGVRSLIERLRASDETLAEDVRLIFRYEGEDSEVLYVREDIDRSYTDAELRQRIETLTLKGLGDPPREGALRDFGGLQSTVRWFEDAVCAYFPDEEWAGVMVVLDRVETPLVDLALDHVED